MTLFHKAISHTLRHEGGFVNDPHDPGGATNMGITHRTLADWRDKPVTVQDVQRLTELEAREIYRALYWNAIMADDMPPGVGFAVFDFGVNSGVSGAVKALQRLVYVKADGAVGPITLAAVRRMDPAAIINGISEARLAHKRRLSTWGRFGVGWTRRVNEVRAVALEMALTPAAPAPAVSNAPWWQGIVEKVLAWLLSR